MKGMLAKTQKEEPQLMTWKAGLRNRANKMEISKTV